MKFTKLRLLGFKSFVDPTELVIADGLTGVVGPNGCGKSNLLEALRWVMGENRAKAMRGSGMEDVIFNGAATRPARSYAEVTLTLDNSDRLAPPSFNTADTLDIVRRITRDAGSAYKVTGKDVRARDVQMLFADASTGAHSPALVRQGQISELVNAKPKARRRVLEEAAGISGLYQRRHEAELKLNATETNLARVDDVLEQLAAQLTNLARQARQAARYREIADALRSSEGILLFRRWAEADQTRAQAEEALRLATQEAAARQGAATRAAAEREEAEAKVPPLREEDTIAAAVLQRLLVERDAITSEESRAKETIETLTGRLTQLRTDKDREAALGRDAGEQIKTLEWEAEQLAEATDGHDGALEALNAAAKAAMAALQNEETRLDRATEDVARLEARHHALERRAAEADALVVRARRDHETSVEAVAAAEAGLSEAQARLGAATEGSQATVEAAARAEEALVSAEAARSSAQNEEADLRAAQSETSGTVKALGAEVQSLQRLLDREATSEGQILDRITVDAGFETALGAALGEDLRSPEAEANGPGWAALPAFADQVPLPGGVRPITDVVAAPPALARRLAAIGIVDRATGERLQPQLAQGQRLVSVEGDLWRWDGFIASSEETPSATARLLQQRNRLVELTEALAEAETAAAAANLRHQTGIAALTAAQAAEREAREARKAADQGLAAAARALSQAEADVSMLSGRRDTQIHARDRRREDLEEAETTLAAAKAEQEGLEDLSDRRDTIEGMKITVAAARATMLEARGAADDAKRTHDARLKRAQEVTKSLSGWRHRASSAETRLGELATRIVETEAQLAEAQAAPEEIAERRAALSGSIEAAETRRKASADALAEGEAAQRRAEEAERQAERAASEAREARARGEALAEAAVDQVRATAERIEEEMETSPEGLLEHLGLDPETLPSAERAEQDVTRLRRQRESLGAVNLRAEEDAAEVQTEHDTLAKEKQDLEEAVGKLKGGIEALNKEGRQRLLEAFEAVNANFRELFTHLFGGGEANLVLVESDDPLEAGLEIMCQPPGKKLATLSLLSGGEQTLTALSLIFAVFLANPSPICVLDEVDAPLDDANVGRFCDLLDEMTRKTDTRFLIITHHAVTMSRMDRLFGVTMAEQGVSQLVSVDLNEAEALVA